MTNAGTRKTAVTPYRRSLPRSAAAGGAPLTGGSAVMLAPPLTDLLERLGRRRFERGGRAVHVLRVLQEVLEDLPLTLPGRCAERCRLEIGQVEPGVLRLSDRGRRGTRQGIAVRAQRHLLVRRGEAAALGPDGRGLGRGEV